MPRRTAVIAALVGALVLLAGCAGGQGTGADADADADAGADAGGEVGVEVDADAEGAGPVVVVTTSILGDIAGDVLADTDARVEVLMPPGADPHGYQPSAADGVALREADLVVAVGLGLEEGLVDTLAAAEEDGVEVLEVGELVDPIEYSAGDVHAEDHEGDEDHEHEGDEDHEHEGDEDHEHEGDHDHDGLDPHVWLDPLRAAAIAEEVASAYAAIDPAAAEAASAGAEEYGQRMSGLDEELAALLAPLPEERRELVTNHDALGYLAARYDLEVVATVLPGTSADVDVTAGAFTGLVELLRESGIPAVFAETTSTDRLARALAEEVPGVEVVELYTGSLGEPGSGADTLEGMLRTDVERIVAALG